MTDNLRLKENFPLAELTTFKIGGEARFFYRATNEKEVNEALKFADDNQLEVFVLGGGSNVLIADEGFDGLVLQIDLRGIKFEEADENFVSVSVSAGEDWDDFVALCVKRDLAGIECLSGIPGLVGGTPIQNVGAYGQEVSETITRVKVLDKESKELLTFSKSECGFEYRKSIFNTSHKDRYIVLEVNYSLEKKGTPKIVYADLKSMFGDTIPSLGETREAVCEIRKSKGMLVRQGGLDSQSAGSFFKNPVVSNLKLREIEAAMINGEKENVPCYLVNEESVKIPAAWLIDQAGFSRGFQKGNAGLSTKHTLALTNRGGAKASEILALKHEIQEEVKKQFGVELATEPNLIGFK